MERFLSLPLHAFVVRILCAWTAATREPAALLVRSCLPTHSKISPMPEDASAASADSPSSASKTACIASAAACAPARLEPSDCVQRTQRARVRACPDCLPACLLYLHPCARASMRPARACVCASSHIVMCLSAQEGEWAGRVDGRPWVGGGWVRTHVCCMCVCVCARLCASACVCDVCVCACVCAPAPAFVCVHSRIDAAHMYIDGFELLLYYILMGMQRVCI